MALVQVFSKHVSFPLQTVITPMLQFMFVHLSFMLHHLVLLISIIAEYTTHESQPKFVEIPNTINSYYTILSKILKTKIWKNHLSLVLWVLFPTLLLTHPTSNSIVNTNSNIGPCDGGFISLVLTALMSRYTLQRTPLYHIHRRAHIDTLS